MPQLAMTPEQGHTPRDGTRDGLHPWGGATPSEAANLKSKELSLMCKLGGEKESLHRKAMPMRRFLFHGRSHGPGLTCPPESWPLLSFTHQPSCLLTLYCDQLILTLTVDPSLNSEDDNFAPLSLSQGASQKQPRETEGLRETEVHRRSLL